MNVNGGGIGSKYCNVFEKRVAEVYTIANEKASKTGGCIVFFDEIDSMVPKHKGNDGGNDYAGMCNAFKTALEGFHELVPTVFTIGATNHLDTIDDAIRSRLSGEIYVGKPELEALQAFFADFCAGSNLPIKALSTEIEEMANAVYGNSFRDGVITLANNAHTSAQDTEEYEYWNGKMMPGSLFIEHLQSEAAKFSARERTKSFVKVNDGKQVQVIPSSVFDEHADRKEIK